MRDTFREVVLWPLLLAMSGNADAQLGIPDSLVLHSNTVQRVLFTTAAHPLAIVGADTIQGTWHQAKLCGVDISEFVIRAATQFSKKVLCHYALDHSSEHLSGTFVFIGRRGTVSGIIEVNHGYITRISEIEGYHSITCSFEVMLSTGLPIIRTVEYQGTKDSSTRQEGFIVFDSNKAPRPMTSEVTYRRIQDWLIENNSQCP